MKNNGIDITINFLTIVSEILALLLIVDTRCLEINEIHLFHPIIIYLFIAFMSITIIFKILSFFISKNIFNGNFSVFKCMVIVSILWIISFFAVFFIIKKIAMDGIVINGTLIKQLF